jgi:O-antigen/teichoic acid export membrane protein
LGPYNLGVSALVMATVAQVNLAFNGGFDTIAVRKITTDRGSAGEVTATVVAFRLAAAVAAALIWTVLVLTIPGLPHRSAWLVGALLVLLSSLGIGFLFTGLERLPVQTAIGTGGALLTAATYFLYFRPGMYLGADLVVGAGVAVVTTAFSWMACRRLLGHWPLRRVRLQQVRALLGEGWRYWIAAIVGYLYSSFQIPLVAYTLGAHDAGLFRTAVTMAAAVELLFSSINSLLVPRLIAWKEMGLDVLRRKQTILLGVSLAVGIPPVALLVLAAPAIFRTMLGAEFTGAVLIFQVLVVGRLIVFCTQMYPFTLVALGLDTSLLAMSITSAVLSVSLTIVMAGKYGIVGVSLVAVLVEVFVGLTCYVLMRGAMARMDRGRS